MPSFELNLWWLTSHEFNCQS